MKIDGNRSEGMAKKKAVKPNGNGGAKVAGMSSDAVKMSRARTPVIARSGNAQNGCSMFVV
jgi:hypothetical protein